MLRQILTKSNVVQFFTNLLRPANRLPIVVAYAVVALAWLSLLVALVDIFFANAALLFLFGQHWAPVTGGLVLLWFVGIGVHEFAHLFVALALRFRILAFAIAPFLVRREGPVFRWRLSTAEPVLGMVRAVPVDADGLSRRFALFVLAGPLANFAMGAFCFSFTLYSSRLPPPVPRWTLSVSLTQPWLWSRQDIPSFWLNMAGAWNLFLCLANMAPLKFRDSLTDGAHLSLLEENPRVVEADLLAASLTASSLWGVRPSEWSEGLLSAALSRRQNTKQDALINLRAYYHALDRQQLEAAGNFLDLALQQREGYPAATRGWLLLEGAFFEGFYRRHGAPAHTFLEEAKGCDVEIQTWLRAEAAVLAAEGCYAQALEKAELALAAAPRSADPGGALAEADWIRALIADCRVRLAQAPTDTRPADQVLNRAFIKVTDSPPGDAPEPVRQAWIGQILPLGPGETRSRKLLVRKCYQADTTADQLRHLLMRGRKKAHYLVLVDEALAILKKTAPAEANWWYENRPNLIGQAKWFAFAADACRMEPTS
jgi:hypothetical protein